MDKVWIRHPETHAEVQVFASALPYHLNAGWQRFDPPPAPESPAEPDDSADTSTPRRRRRSTSAEES